MNRNRCRMGNRHISVTSCLLGTNSIVAIYRGDHNSRGVGTIVRTGDTEPIPA